MVSVGNSCRASKGGFFNQARRRRILVLSRNKGETIIIDRDIRVTILNVSSSGQVRLGIAAPDCVSIDRLEIHERKQAKES